MDDDEPRNVYSIGLPQNHHDMGMEPVTKKMPSALSRVLHRAREAYGGLQRLQNISSFSAEYAYTEQRPNGPLISWRNRTYRVRGGRIRIEEEYPDGMRITRVVNAQRGWIVVQPADEDKEIIAELSPEEVEGVRRDVKIIPANFLAHADEYDLRYLGTGPVEGYRGMCLDFVGEETYYYFDPSSYLCRRMADWATGHIWSFHRYRLVDGVATPHRIKIRDLLGSIITAELLQVRYNLPIPDTLFSPGDEWLV